MGFQRKFHIKSMFLGQNKYICGRFGGHMDTMNTASKLVPHTQTDRGTCPGVGL